MVRPPYHCRDLMRESGRQSVRSWLRVALHPVPLGTPGSGQAMVCSGFQDIHSTPRDIYLARQPSSVGRTAQRHRVAEPGKGRLLSAHPTPPPPSHAL